MYNLICRGDRPRSPVGLFVLFVLFLYFTGDRDGRPYYLCFTGDRDGRPYKSSVSFADSSTPSVRLAIAKGAFRGELSLWLL